MQTIRCYAMVRAGCLVAAGNRFPLGWSGGAALSIALAGIAKMQYYEREMRIAGKDGISRAISVTAKGRRVVVVRVFVKTTQRTPRREIDLALKRAKEVHDR